jgi:hypothetical protein
MKKILLLLGLAVSLTACVTSKHSSTSKYIIMGDRVMDIDSTTLATLSSFEYEYYDGKLVREVSLTVTQKFDRSEVEELILTLDKHFKGKNKIEINFDNDK